MTDAALIVFTVLAAQAALTLCALTMVNALDARWRPIVRAYLEARSAAAGKPMQVREDDAAPGRIWAPRDSPQFEGDEDYDE